MIIIIEKIGPGQRVFIFFNFAKKNVYTVFGSRFSIFFVIAIFWLHFARFV